MRVPLVVFSDVQQSYNRVSSNLPISSICKLTCTVCKFSTSSRNLSSMHNDTDQLRGRQQSEILPLVSSDWSGEMNFLSKGCRVKREKEKKFHLRKYCHNCLGRLGQLTYTCTCTCKKVKGLMVVLLASKQSYFWRIVLQVTRITRIMLVLLLFYPNYAENLTITSHARF